MKRLLFILMFLPVFVMGQGKLRDATQSEEGGLSSYERLLLYGSDYSIRKWYLDEPEIGRSGVSFYFDVVEVVVGGQSDYFLHIQQSGMSGSINGNECWISYNDLVLICRYFEELNLDTKGCDELMGGYLTSDNVKITYTTKENTTKWYLQFNVYKSTTLYSVKNTIMEAFSYSLKEMDRIMGSKNN